MPTLFFIQAMSCAFLNGSVGSYIDRLHFSLRIGTLDTLYRTQSIEVLKTQIFTGVQQPRNYLLRSSDIRGIALDEHFLQQKVSNQVFSVDPVTLK
jgi:hypothetical protein